jgi:hypothetical protein
LRAHYHPLKRSVYREHDIARDQQHQVIRIAERTLALPYGRAMFTFATVPALTRESFAIPKLEFQIRLHPQNLVVGPETNKIPQDSINWGEFHNGVAAGLRIAPVSQSVESSWIAFNKPSELTPEHAGFLYALGLTGHLKEMLTWQTYSYLTPKHDLTSIGILLGLSAANIGTGHEHVTKLLAVHAPALLPDPTVDLNVPLVTQTAALTGVGLLYMGTRKRHMAEVLLNEMKKRDNTQPDLTNEHREAYTLAAGFGFGMVMLGKGSEIPADRDLVNRLRSLIYGTSNAAKNGDNVPAAFDVNLTSPAATIALGLMFLRTERRDIADVIAIPDAVSELHRIQPNFLLMRTVARSLIMWDKVAPTNEWLMEQLPLHLRRAIDMRNQGKKIDDALELAYFNIVAGACFVLALKYAGTAEEGAYMLISVYWDLYNRLAYSSGTWLSSKERRAPHSYARSRFRFRRPDQAIEHSRMLEPLEHLIMHGHGRNRRDQLPTANAHRFRAVQHAHPIRDTLFHAHVFGSPLLGRRAVHARALGCGYRVHGRRVLSSVRTGVFGQQMLLAGPALSVGARGRAAVPDRSGRGHKRGGLHADTHSRPGAERSHKGASDRGQVADCTDAHPQYRQRAVGQSRVSALLADTGPRRR